MMIETREGRVFKGSNGTRTQVRAFFGDDKGRPVDDGIPAKKPYPNAAMDDQDYYDQRVLLQRCGATATEVKQAFGLSNATYKALERGRLLMPDSMKTVLERMRDRRVQSA